MSDAKTLLDLVRADSELVHLKKQLDSLPQREKLMALRTKRAEVEAKAAQVATMRLECDQKARALADEEATLKAKVAEAQAQMDATSNYKEVASFSRELEGFSKRLEHIETDTLAQMERAEKIAAVEQQVTDALEKIERQDAELLASYQSQGATLQKEQLLVQQVRGKLAQSLSAELLVRYEKAREAKGGVGAAHLEGSHCSGCRVELTEGQLIKVRQSAAIGECPFCHRLLVVES